VASSGFVTDDSTVSALAPMYSDDTDICGGEMFGNCATGSVGMEIAPMSKMIAEQTEAKIGRVMKNCMS